MARSQAVDPTAIVLMKSRRVVRLLVRLSESILNQGKHSIQSEVFFPLCQPGCRQLGHQSRTNPTIYVKPLVKGQENDYNDVDAIAEAALRPNLRVAATISEMNSRLLITAPKGSAQSHRFLNPTWPAYTSITVGVLNCSHFENHFWSGSECE